ncbi:MAG: metalloregulator ArsR/SmtB family transcription factor [Candidatus Melainabacteria bacterium]|nr:metalloregulator ArsR/SmtB family transcription factor [Candidatus Melainabacteria bacterium]
MNKKSKIQSSKPKALSREALEIVAARFKVMGDASRLEILQCLMEREHSVQELCERTSMGQANISKHLALLTEQGILNRRKQGLFVIYSIADTTVYQLCDIVCGALSNRFSTAQDHFKETSV